MASAPDSARRPLRRVVRSLVARLLPRSRRPGLAGLGLRATPLGPSASAELAGALPVRAPWQWVRWYQAFRGRRATSGGMVPGGVGPGGVASGRADESGGPRRGSAVRRSLAASRRLGGPHQLDQTAARRPLAAALPAGVHTGSLISARPAGPDVRPGHELTMRPAFGMLPAAATSGAPRSADATAPGRRDGSAGTGGRDGGVVIGRGGGAGAPTGGLVGDGMTGGPAGRRLGIPLSRGLAIGSRLSMSAASATAVDPGVSAGIAETIPVRSAYPGGGRVPGLSSSGTAGPFMPGESARRPGSGRRGPGDHRDAGHERVGDDHGGYEFGGHLPVRPGRAGRPLYGHGPGGLELALGRPVAGGAAGRGAAGRGTAGSGAAGGLGVLGGAGPMVGAPVAGPSVSSPQPAGDLRVLGAATLPPGNVPDPTGAVTVSPAAGHRAGPPTRLRSLGGDWSGRVLKGLSEPQGKSGPQANVVSRDGRSTLSAREKWEAAVGARPLEAPRALPVAFHAMASAITGRARPPLFTTGPATRAALAAAGALGATTGTVVHLPAVPTAAPAVTAVLAHELTHTRSPVRRPRFLLGGASGLLDDDERQALAAGRDRLAQASTTGAGIVDSLPVGGGIGAVGDVATRAARAAVLEATASPAFSSLGGMAAGAAPAVAGAFESAGSSATDSASGVLDSVTGAASPVVSAVGSAASGLAGAGRSALDPDQIVEIVEQRLLREIERRGGRWAGVF